MKIALRIALLAAGAALFGWFVVEAGPGEIWRTLKQLGGTAPLVVLPYLVVYLFDAGGWMLAFSGRDGPHLSYPVLFKIRMAGEAVNNVIPSAYVGGEPVKVYLAKKRGVRGVRGAQSVVVGKTTQTLAEMLLIALGALAALHSIEAGSPLHKGMIFVTVAAALVVVMLFWVQHLGMFAGALKLLRALHIKVRAIEDNAEHLEHLDDQIRGFYRNETGRFVASTLFYLFGWVSGALEILFVSHLLGAQVHWSQALAVEAFTAVAKGVGLFVPGALGVQESGIVFLFRALGLPDALGASYAILRRGREVVYVLLGGAFLLSEETHLKDLAERVRAETAEEL